MIGVDSPDRIMQSFVKRKKFFTRGISRFVDQIITRHPVVVFIPPGDRFPETDRPVLEFLIDPERCHMGGIIAVPVLVL